MKKIAKIAVIAKIAKIEQSRNSHSLPSLITHGYLTFHVLFTRKSDEWVYFSILAVPAALLLLLIFINANQFNQCHLR